ncbi:hypothetical protein MG293_020523 [Ovis ammon polii]|uniref:Pulmonary surfactant-associated protein D n=1 Tax=Ovis ammon polii TaxID=230172 RepID=A0AAD4TN01_OVIAM|nr:hypothetical protein MG293_020523 [Ovis ammon polii]
MPGPAGTEALPPSMGPPGTSGPKGEPGPKAENEALTQLATAQNKAAFLSMTDTRNEGIYPMGELLVYSLWAPHEPNNRVTDKGPESCIEIYRDGS